MRECSRREEGDQQLASLESIRYTNSHLVVSEGQVRWVVARPTFSGKLPQICWQDGSTWGEANLWALHIAERPGNNAKTTLRSMSHLHAYAKWLESENVEWWDFPSREGERCLTRFRGALVRARDEGQLAPSTASQRMATVIRFYKWVTSSGLLSPDWPMWTERIVGIKLTDIFGLEHTMRVATTDLAIPNRKVAGAIKLEDGLLPVSRTARAQILELADDTGSEEHALMLRLGFLSGLRIGSITDLKVETIVNASLDPNTGWRRIAVGPAARPPVATKFGVSGMVLLPTDLRDRLIEYASSVRRLKREALADENHRELLFLTRHGKPFTDESRAINVAMNRLRAAGRTAGLDVLRDFHFHRSRATFATELMRVALKFMPVPDAVQFVREACLHKDDETTLRYVRFIESTKAMAESADAFTEAFLGLAKSRGASNG